jgi:hypothetical protein
MSSRRLHLSLVFFVAALVLAAALIASLLRLQNDAFEAADWVSHSLDVRARLQQLLATIDDGPTQTPRALGMVVSLREKLGDRPRALEVLETISVDLGFGRERARLRVEELIGEETGLLLDRRQTLAKESGQARFALIIGGIVVVLLLAAAFAHRPPRQPPAASAAEDQGSSAATKPWKSRVAARTADLRRAENAAARVVAAPAARPGRGAPSPGARTARRESASSSAPSSSTSRP